MTHLPKTHRRLHYTVRDEVIKKDSKLETYAYRGTVWIEERRTNAIVRAAADSGPSCDARVTNSTLFDKLGHYTVQDFDTKPNSHKRL